MRYLILIHRYLGIAIGILIIGWCLTGMVMMYVRYPEVSQAERLRRLSPLDWRGCCTVGAGSIPDDARIQAFQVENLGSRPVLHLQFADRNSRLIDLSDGQELSGISQPQAAAIAQGGNAKPPRFLRLIADDEWTVSGEFNPMRPLYRFSLEDAAGTQVYVSARNGRLVQLTSAHQRFWNWVGSVPHWLYFAQLRRHPALWTQVVIWTSLAGCFLTLLGVYLGVRQFLRRPAGRWSAYRGLLYWHHLPGLIFGLFALTWVASGLISMNPWGFLESADASSAIDDLVGPAIPGSAVLQTLRMLPAAALPAGIVAVQSSRLRGRLYLVATRSDGSRWRFGANVTPAPLRDPDWQGIANTLTGATGVAPALLVTGDRYYHDRPGVPARLPVMRVLLNDEHGTRYYLDAVTGDPLGVIDNDARWYRWLHIGLHTLDFSPALRSRPLWDVLMLVLLTGVTLVAVTGTWLGWRRYIRIGAR